MQAFLCGKCGEEWKFAWSSSRLCSTASAETDVPREQLGNTDGHADGRPGHVLAETWLLPSHKETLKTEMRNAVPKVRVVLCPQRCRCHEGPRLEGASQAAGFWDGKSPCSLACWAPHALGCGDRRLHKRMRWTAHGV